MPLLTNMLPRRLLIWRRVRQFILSLHNLASVVKVLPNPDLLDIKSISPTNSVDNLPSNQLSLLLRHSHCYPCKKFRRSPLSSFKAIKLSKYFAFNRQNAISNSCSCNNSQYLSATTSAEVFDTMTPESFLRAVWSSPL